MGLHTVSKSQFRIQGGAPRCVPPLRTKIFLISCSFWENPANLYVGAPLEVGAPPTGNPVSAPESGSFTVETVHVNFIYIWGVVTEEVITFRRIRDFAKIVISPQK